MSEYFHIVPWINSQEWHTVYTLIISLSIDDKKLALDYLLIWKARCPALPSGVESTLTLLQVYLQDSINCDSNVDDQIYRLAYSSAIMRFVNHMLDSETAKGSSLYRAANNLGVPDWIVDLRHNTAHSNNLPSLELLREACTLSLHWLENNYWNKYKNVVSDYISGQKEQLAIVSDTSDIVSKLLNFCISIGIVINSGSKIKNLADIHDAYLRASIVDDVRDLVGDQIDLSNLKTVSVKGLENHIMNQCTQIVTITDVHIHVNKALLADDSMFLSIELLKLFDKNRINSLKLLPRQYLKCFESLILFLHTNDLLHELILGLIRFTQQSEDVEQNILASLWTAEILKSLIKIKRFTERIKQSNSDLKSKSRNELLSLYHHWFPNDNNDFMLDMLKPIPSELTDITVIQPLISTYNPYLTYFISGLLELLEPCLPQAARRKICMLANLISKPEKYPVTTNKIYTVEDLKESPDIEIMVDETCDLKDKSMEVEVQNESMELQSVWRTASSDHSWSSCPIGQLPWQII